MSQAELRIFHTTKQIESKADAFSYGFSEGVGRALGWAFVITIFGAVYSFMSADIEAEPKENVEATQ